MATLSALKTPVAKESIRPTLRAAAPDWSDNEVDCFAALIRVETANGSALTRYNVGNLAAGGFAKQADGSWVDKLWTTADIWRPSWFDKPGATHDRMMRGEAPSAFRAYASLEDGLRGFVALMNTKRYQPLKDAAALRDVSGFVRQLKETGYSPDYNSAHEATFRSILDGEVNGYTPTLPNIFGPEGLSQRDDRNIGIPVTVAVVLTVATVAAVLYLRKK